ncbi:MAG: thiol-disulfide oxidoreductase DCC family protein [Gemmataceae bacterium]
MTKPIVLFDGLCALCDASVQWLIEHDSAGRLRFAALQSETGQALLTRFGLPRSGFKSLLLVEGDRYWLRSTAALRIAGYLDRPWNFGSAFLLLPAFLRDPLYDLVAMNRYRWFGRRESCRVPSPEICERFLD